MGDIVTLDTATNLQQDRAGALWRVYCTARERAERTRDIADGFAAGRAWAAFLKEFLSP